MPQLIPAAVPGLSITYVKPPCISFKAIVATKFATRVTTWSGGAPVVN
jgi:hypothetical protein